MFLKLFLKLKSWTITLTNYQTNHLFFVQVRPDGSVFKLKLTIHSSLKHLTCMLKIMYHKHNQRNTENWQYIVSSSASLNRTVLLNKYGSMIRRSERLPCKIGIGCPTHGARAAPNWMSPTYAFFNIYSHALKNNKTPAQAFTLAWLVMHGCVLVCKGTNTSGA